MMNNLFFKYDGIHSKDMGVKNVSLGGGLRQGVFLPQRQIEEEIIPGRDKPYFFGVSLSPLVLPMTLYFESGMTLEKRRRIARWLNTSYYKPLIFDEQPNIIFYCMPNNESSISHNGLGQGYLQVELRCDSPYGYSPMNESPIYDYSNNQHSGSNLSFKNEGDTPCKPILRIEKVGVGDIYITDTSGSGNSMELSSLMDGELIVIDCETKDASTNAGEFDYEKFNGEYLEFDIGENNWLIQGKCKLKFSYELRYLLG